MYNDSQILERWLKTTEFVGGYVKKLGVYHMLRKLYDVRTANHYHTITHVMDSLAVFDEYRKKNDMPVSWYYLEMAIWFHDAFYNVNRSDNEERSAQLAEECCKMFDEQYADESVGNLILATKGHSADDEVSQIMIDVDLAILGKGMSAYGEYKDGIYAEYKTDWNWDPPVWARFKDGRAKFLKGLLEQEHIYYTDYFRDKYEAQARRNIGIEIEELRNSG